MAIKKYPDISSATNADDTFNPINKNGKFLSSNGSSLVWEDAGMVKLGEISLNSLSAFYGVSFTGLSPLYKEYLIVYDGIFSSVDNSAIAMRFNNPGNNFNTYRFGGIYVNGTTTSPISFVMTNATGLGDAGTGGDGTIVAANSLYPVNTSNTQGAVGFIRIFNANSNVSQKVVHWSGTSGISGTNYRYVNYIGAWNSYDLITSIFIQPIDGSYIQSNGKFILYGGK